MLGVVMNVPVLVVRGIVLDISSYVDSGAEVLRCSGAQVLKCY